MNDNIGGLLTLIFLIAVYFLPTIIAAKKAKKNGVAILLTNIFLGWTGLGWIIALIWSATND